MSLKYRLQKRPPEIRENIVIPEQEEIKLETRKLPYISYAIISLILIICSYLVIF